MMIEQNYADLDKLIEDGRMALQYAWDHYDELAARPSIYTIYGPASWGYGAFSPSRISTKDSERKLRFYPGRGRHIIYELDENYMPIRIKYMRKKDIYDCTFHVFELGGVIYARPFFEDRKAQYLDKVLALKFKDGLPELEYQFFHGSVVAQFFEYLPSGNRQTTIYSYNPRSKYNIRGYPISFDVPINAPESPASAECREESVPNIDFSRWFHK